MISYVYFIFYNLSTAGTEFKLWKLLRAENKYDIFYTSYII
jgi:hypothetical protein